MKFKVTGLAASEKWNHEDKETVATFEVSLTSEDEDLGDQSLRNQSLELEMYDINEFEKFRYGKIYEMEWKPVD